MLKFKEDELFVIGFPKSLATYIEYAGLQNCYKDKFLDESYQVYAIALSIVEAVYEMNFNSEFIMTEAFEYVFEPVLDVIDQNDNLSDRMVKMFDSDLHRLSRDLNDIGILQERGFFDIFRISEDKLYLTKVNLERT